MFDKLGELERRFEEVGDLLVLPETMKDMSRYSKLSKEYKDLGLVVAKNKEYRKVKADLAGTKELLSSEKDPGMREMAKMEIEELLEKIPELEAELKELMIPKDPNDDKNCILEIRSGAGGDEASLFAGDLYRMYQRFCDKKKFKMVVSDSNEGTAGGFDKIVAKISGEGAYGLLKYESGVHRVQRVPSTETQGRVHTSAASVAVLPEVDDVEVDIDLNEVRRDEFCSSGPGGQSVNTTYSAIRLTHEPTGIVVQCQDQKSKLKNYDKALQELKSRIYAMELAKQQEEIGAERKSLIGRGDRADKIRTYNWPQGRVTDHRINKTVYNLEAIINGNVGEFMEALRMADNAEKMKDGQD